MSLSKPVTQTALFSDRVNHSIIINKTNHVYRPRSSYSSVYISSSAPIQATQSIDLMWWALQGAHKAGKALSYCSEVPLRMRYGDMHEANEVEVRLTRIGLMCAQMVGNLRPSSIAIFLLQVATEFGYTVVDLVKRLIALFTDWNLCPTQLFQSMRDAVMSFLVQWGIIGGDGEVVEDPIQNVVQAEQSLDIKLDESQITALAGIMGGMAVILAAGFAGVTDYSPNKGFLKSIAEFGSKASKMKSGLYAILTCVKDFSTFVKECVLNYFGSKPADSVIKAIESLNFTFGGEPVKAEELFDALNSLNTAEGEEKMATNAELYTKGVAVCGVFSRIISGQLVEAFSIPPGTVSLLSQTLRTFEQRVKSAGVKQNMGNVRFTPFCIWIAGDPGCGKSVTLAEIVRLLMCTLQKRDAQKYEVPEESQWCHSANFTQEYHTGYNGQYIFQIDDMCQDKPGTLKTSSALQFIQWVSSIPANVTQAALEDKKCPFRSKILICTSNELYPNRSHEIISEVAFQRRRNILVHAKVKQAGNDEHLNWPIEFSLRDPVDQTKPPTALRDFYALMDVILDAYTIHFDKQTKLVNDIRAGNADSYLAYRAQMDAVKAEQSADLNRRECLEGCPCVDSEPVFREDHMIEYYQEHPILDDVLMHPVTREELRITGRRAEESWVAQDWLMQQNQYRYDAMMTVISSMALPEYHFRDCALTTRDDAEITISQIDARRVALIRDWHWNDITVNPAFDFVFRNYAETTVFAEQSAFWHAVQEKIPSWDEFCISCKESSAVMRRAWEELRVNVWWQVLLGLSTAIGGYFAYKKWARGPWREIVDAEESYDHKVVRGKPIARSAAQQSYNHEVGRSKARVMTIQAVRSSFVQSVFHKNMVELKWPHGSLNGIFIKGTTLLTCSHFFSGVAEGTKFTIVKYPKYAKPVEVVVSYESRRMVVIPGAEDAVLYHVGKVIDSYKDISTKFCDGALPEYMDAAITSVYPEQEIVIGPTSTFVENQVVEFRKGVRTSDGADDRPIARIVKGFNFQGHYRRGKSGSPLIADEKVNRTPTIFGIQTCISEKFETSYFEALTKQQIAQALGKIEAEQSMFEEADDRWEQEDDEAWFDAPEDIHDICALSLEFIGPVKEKVHQASDTKLRRSPMNPFFDVMPDTKLFKPAVLRDAEVDILTKSMAGYSRRYGLVDHRILQYTTEQFAMEDKMVRRCDSKRLLSRDEVLNGLHGQGLKGLDLNTSPGIPLTFQKKPGREGKKTWITMCDDDQRIMCEDMWTEFDKAEADLRRGKMISLTSYACLKDELRTEEKVAAKKTRSFIVLPLIYNMMIRKYFGQWIACQHRLAGKISSAVGIDANSQWTDLKKRLCAMGREIEDFDYSDWDRSLHPEWFGAYAERVSVWYGDKRGSPEWAVRELLMRQLVFMNIQVGNWLLRTHGGNKSGCAITAEINTDIHDMLTYYVWRKICLETGRQDIASLSHFRERVALALYGDDMLKATRPDVTPWFNGTAMKAVIEELGMHITPGDKDETKGFRIKSIDEVTFLKRGFLTLPGDGGRVRAPLDKSVIQRMVMWIHKSDSVIDAQTMNVRGALREAFFWGEDFFRDFTERCQTAWTRSKCAHAPFPQVYYQSVSDAWNAGHGDMLPAQFQFRVVSGPEVGAEEEL